MAAVSSLSLTAMSQKSETRSFTVYSEDCTQRYELRVDFDSDKAVLLDKEANTVVKAFTNGNNPYANADDYDFLVYTDKREDCRYLGVAGNKLFNVENDLEINVDEARYKDIYSSLEGISYDSIPSDAYFCRFSYYFKNLKNDGIGYNNNNTCTLVSMQILFNYYDSTWSDNIIDEVYDTPVSEHKITCDTFTTSPASDGAKFHSYLISYCDDYLGTNVTSTGLTNMLQNSLINHYVGTTRGLEYSNNTSEGNFGDMLSNKHVSVIKDAINSGRPAILNTLGHSMVAFAYDDNYAYLMSGWKYDRFMARLSWNHINGNIFSNPSGAYDLILKCKHTCSNNYFSTIYGKYICPRQDL